ncbi:energy transducer TonB [Carboxylicivirga sp. N1Y90]|uniref:energy transducer TonB n=1 Tax=Carboxylicivirga fragile TaxID=3417571 RepID=UPI003D32F947|nr:energy transducer TonB [Marinilabiliaceae bacterium N1Y90]
MSRGKANIYLLLLKVCYGFICGLVKITNNKRTFIRAKIAIGTLILSLNSTLLLSQNKNDQSKVVYSKHDTLRLDVCLEPDLEEHEEVIVTCYMGVPRKNRIPIFYGGERALNEFVEKELVYPKKALRKKIYGTVTLSYVIDELGDVIEVVVIKKLGYGCDKEAIRIVNSLPKFQPGIKNGEPAKFEKSISIDFNLPVK